MSHDLVVLSPEKTILTYRLAGLGSRCVAHFIDVLLVIASTIGLALGIISSIGRLSPAVASGITMVVTSAFPFLYFILLEALWNGRTVGKSLLGLRVRMADGSPLTMRGSLGRNLLRPADFLPFGYFFGLLAVFTNPKSQRIGDLVADTVVVHERRSESRFVPAPHNAGVHPFEATVGDLRGMTNEEYLALRRMCDRFPELPTTVQERMLHEVWEPIARRRNIPSVDNVHPIYLAEATVMKYGRQQGVL